MFQFSLRRTLNVAFALALPIVAGRANAQGAVARGRVLDTIPSTYRPPAGMCRVWVDGVPASQQPAPTDCAKAVLNKPSNGRVIYGEDPNRTKVGNGVRPPVRGFAPPAEVKKDPIKGAIPDQPRGVARTPPESWESKRISDQQLFGDRPAHAPASSYAGAGQSGSGSMTGNVGTAGNGTAGNGNTGNGNTGAGGAGGSGILGDPRYFNSNPGVKPPGTGSSVCLDRDQDGWCDDMRFGPPACLDKDKDGRCDDLPEFASLAYPQTLPHMRSVLDVIEGRPSVEVARWLGTNEFSVRVPDQGRGGTPWRAIFLDQQGQLLQVWTDRNRDGIADRVEIFRDGARVKTIQR